MTMEMTKEKKIFLARFTLFTCFALIFPFIFIAWRYELFKKVSTVSFSGWGIIAILILFFFARYILKMIKKNKPYSMTTQLVNGFLKVVLPLLTVLLILNSIKDSIDLTIQTLIFVILSESVAIILNPLPKWAYDNKIDQQEDLMDTFIGKLKTKKKEKVKE